MSRYGWRQDLQPELPVPCVVGECLRNRGHPGTQEVHQPGGDVASMLVGGFTRWMWMYRRDATIRSPTVLQDLS